VKHTYTATVHWERNGAVFTDNQYSRAHTWHFDGGVTVPASSSPAVVPAPLSDPSAVDPEEAYVASLASCHFLWFLHLARMAGFVVDAYTDRAAGTMEKNEKGKPWISRVALRPQITFTGETPDAAKLAELHHRAHEECFIANSVKTEVVVEPAG
jgi:organic hydroperoxide reductase OsmC/OhrA